METLSLDQINSVLANTRDRGGAERAILNFIESGELAIDLRSLAGKEKAAADSLYNSFSQNIKKMSDKAKVDSKPFPALKVVKSGEKDKDQTVILVNLDVHARMSGNNADENTEADAA